MCLLDSPTIAFHPSVQIPSTLCIYSVQAFTYLVGTSMIVLMRWNVMLPPVAFVLVLECFAHVCGGVHVVSGASAIAAIYANRCIHTHMMCAPIMLTWMLCFTHIFSIGTYSYTYYSTFDCSFKC